MATSHLFVSALRRNFSSSSPALRRNFSSDSRVGVIQRRSNPVQRTRSNPEAVEDASISPEIHMKNGALALFLVSSCAGIMYYSMNAVGQAGANSEDPLALLKEEAAEAQEKHDNEEKSTGEATEMLKQFSAGDFDPDKYDDLEDEKPKRPWWKVW
jgi:hypothetical protein